MSALSKDWGGRGALIVLGGIGLMGLCADVLASDLPLAVRHGGHTYWFPCLSRPVALQGHDQQSLKRSAEWIWPTPIPFGPVQTVAATGEERATPPPWGPGGAHWLGTDELGRDVAARLIHGARVSLSVALLTVLLSVVVGVLVGATGGYARGLVDAVLSRLTELMLTFPLVFFLMALLSFIRTQSTWPLILGLGLTRWPEIARLIRAEVLSLQSQQFVLAARALGASPARIILRHLLPNAMGPVWVAATFGVGSAILLETSLTFLGIGIAPPTASWGELLLEAHRTLHHPGAWWLAVFPGGLIVLTVLSVNALGEAVRRSVDVRL